MTLALPAVPVSLLDPLEQTKRYISDSIANAAGLDGVRYTDDPNADNVQIETWEDWVRLIPKFNDLADWHTEIWDWAWRIESEQYVEPVVAIAPRGGGKSSSVENIIAALGARNKRKFVLYVRATQAQANASVSNIASILENGSIKDYYPLMGQRLISVWGQAKGWNRTMLRTANNFTVAAFGLDTALRGAKVDDARPDLVCHAIGTPIFDPDLNQWLPVQSHPGMLTVKRGPGLRVFISGVPDPEIVTPEHRYWGRAYASAATQKLIENYDPTPGWIEAQDLQTRNHFLGLPIDTQVNDPQPIKHIDVVQGAVFLEKQETFTTPIEFSDPEWWWFFGLWWRRGSFMDDKIAILFRASEGEDKRKRVEALLNQYNIEYKIQLSAAGPSDSKRTTYHLCFSHIDFYLWLKSWTSLYFPGRVPPLWVERLPHYLQKQLVLGFFDMDRSHDQEKQVRIAGPHAGTFLSLRRICTRLGILGIVYSNGDHNKASNYTFYARDGVRDALGLDVDPSDAPYRDGFIADGYLWSRVKRLEPVRLETFIPIETRSHTYLTTFGLSHNCLDDIDEKTDSPAVTEKKIKTITTSILPAGAPWMTVLAVQNKILDDGIFARFAEGTADFLADRILIGPIPAVKNLKYLVLNNIPKITGGTATWSGQSLEVCERQMTLWGVKAFLAEAQHLTNITEGGLYENVTYNRIPEHDLPDLETIVCWIDPAVSANARSHCQAIQIDGIEREPNRKKRPRIYRLFSWEGIDTPDNTIRLALREATLRNCKRIGIETNQGGELWESTYYTIAEEMLADGDIEYIPTFASEKASSATGSKEERAGRMLSDYTRNLVVHVEGTHETLEQALGRFPLISPDDLVDAAYWAWYDLRKNDHYRGKPKHARVNAGKLFARSASAGSGGRPSRSSMLRRLMR